MTCKVYEPLITDWKLNELEKSQVKQVEDHLKLCYDCLKYSDELNALFGTLEEVKKELPKPPLGYFSTLLSRTRQRMENESAPSFIERLYALLRYPVAATAAAALFLVLAFSSGRFYERILVANKDQYYAQLAQELIKEQIFEEYSGNQHPLESLIFLEDQQIENVLETVKNTIEG